MNLAGYQDVIAKDADTALKVNISWHVFYPGSSTTPWQLEGVIRAMKQDGYDPNLIHACHNRTVVIDAHLGERENKRLNVVKPTACATCICTKAKNGSTSATPVGDLANKFWCSTRSTRRASTFPNASSAKTSSIYPRSRPRLPRRPAP
ncbi:hypothetical protein [Candidatus Amarobacter glycogenicus]|uniref:hypothetical protein n=1 Tax=Candidatus Amarobacter glycogenicus TaxID=3140699 RepID=UPI0031CC4386